MMMIMITLFDCRYAKLSSRLWSVDAAFLCSLAPSLPLFSPLSYLFFKPSFSKLTEDWGKIILPFFCEKIVCLPKDALSPGGQVPHHYLESAKITQRGGLRVIYSAHMPKRTRACARIHKDTHTHINERTHTRAHGHTEGNVCLFFSVWLEKYLRAMKWGTCEEDPRG